MGFGILMYSTDCQSNDSALSCFSEVKFLLQLSWKLHTLPEKTLLLISDCFRLINSEQQTTLHCFITYVLGLSSKPENITFLVSWTAQRMLCPGLVRSNWKSLGLGNCLFVCLFIYTFIPTSCL